MLQYGEVAGGRMLRMEPRARGVDYGPAAAGPNAEMDRETRLANNKKCVCECRLPACVRDWKQRPRALHGPNARQSLHCGQLHDGHTMSYIARRGRTQHAILQATPVLVLLTSIHWQSVRLGASKTVACAPFFRRNDSPCHLT